MRDLIYLDVGKAASLLSQAEDGLLQEIRESEEDSSDLRGTIGSGLALIKADVGSATSERGARSETRTLHHAILTRLEASLQEGGYLVELDSALSSAHSAAELRDLAIARPYVRATGWVVFEDYTKVRTRVEQFNRLVDVMRHAARSGVEKTAEFQEFRATIAQHKSQAEAHPDKRQRQTALRKVRQLEEQLAALVDSAIASTVTTGLDDWLVEGVKYWIDCFYPGQLHFRLYPSQDLPGFQLLANLKRTSFVDADVENVLFAYGTRPNVKLSVIGLVTSAPGPEGAPFDPMAEFAHTEQENAVAIFEKSFRGVFSGLQDFERLSRFERYPNVTLFPIAVYRDVVI